MRPVASPNSKMPRAVSRVAAAVLLVCGEDEFAVKERAKQIYLTWTRELGGMDHEVLDASVANSGEALRVLTRLHEALQTLPFFGSAKVVWLKDCNFLGEERAAATQAVTDTLVDLAEQLKAFPWDNVRLLVSAGKVDKRKVFYKTLETLGTVEILNGWSASDRDWTDQAEAWGRKALRARQKEIADDALAELITRVGPNARQLDHEIEKLSLYAADRDEIVRRHAELGDLTLRLDLSLVLFRFLVAADARRL